MVALQLPNFVLHVPEPVLHHVRSVAARDLDDLYGLALAEEGDGDFRPEDFLHSEVTYEGVVVDLRLDGCVPLSLKGCGINT